MDNRKGNPRTTVDVSSSRITPVLLVCSLACALLLGGYFLFATGSGADPTDATAPPVAVAPAGGLVDTPTVAEPPLDLDAAVIIDAVENERGADATGAIAAANVEAPIEQVTRAKASATEAARIPHGAAVPRARNNATSRRVGKQKSREPDLLTTLLANIAKQQDNALVAGAPETGLPSARRTSQADTMDELIARIQNNRGENYTKSAAALATIGATTLPANGSAGRQADPVSSASVQFELGKCPKANTVSGIECRKKVCAKQVRPDAACPKP